eukprot:g27423.t1
MQPGFHQKWLNFQVSEFGRAGELLVSTLKASTAQGKAVDMEERFGSVALDIIGKSVFNYEFGSVEGESPVVKAAIQRGSPAFQIGDCRRPCPCGCHMHQGAWGKRMVGEDIQCLSWSQMSTGSVTDKRTKCLPDFITPNLIAPDELTEDGDMRVACVALMSSQAAKVQLPAAIETGQDFGAYD